MGSVNHTSEAQFGAKGRIFQVGTQVGGDTLGNPAHRIRGEYRSDGHVGEKLDRQRQVFAANANASFRLRCSRVCRRRLRSIPPARTRSWSMFPLRAIGPSGRRGRASLREPFRRRRKARARRPLGPASARRSGANHCRAQSAAVCNRRAARSPWPSPREVVPSGCPGSHAG